MWLALIASLRGQVVYLGTHPVKLGSVKPNKKGRLRFEAPLSAAVDGPIYIVIEARNFKLVMPITMIAVQTSP